MNTTASHLNDLDIIRHDDLDLVVSGTDQRRSEGQYFIVIHWANPNNLSHRGSFELRPSQPVEVIGRFEVEK